MGFNKSYRLDMGSSKRSGQHFFLFMYIVSIVFWVSNSNENRRKIHVNPPDYHTHFGRELRPEQLPKKTGHKLQLKQRLTRSGVEWSEECGVWSVECGLWSVECGVEWRMKCECEVWSVKCGVWSVKCDV